MYTIYPLNLVLLAAGLPISLPMALCTLEKREYFSMVFMFFQVHKMSCVQVNMGVA